MDYNNSKKMHASVDKRSMLRCTCSCVMRACSMAMITCVSGSTSQDWPVINMVIIANR
jgi:hypothetical protein